VSQVIYDVSFFFIPAAVTGEKFVWTFIVSTLSSFGGLSAGLFTNVMSLIIYYIVLNVKSFDIWKRYRLILSMVFVPAALFSIFAGMLVINSREAQIQLAYFTIRCSCVVLNLFLSVLIKRKLSRMSKIADKSNASIQIYDPLHALVARIKYYPLCQSIYVIGAIWYYTLVGFGGTQNYADNSQSSALVLEIALAIYAVANAITGIGYFIIFLVMQVQFLFYYIILSVC
jgi:hypothetical protein